MTSALSVSKIEWVFPKDTVDTTTSRKSLTSANVLITHIYHCGYSMICITVCTAEDGIGAQK